MTRPNSVFENRVESSSRVIAEAIALYENLLEQQEKAHNETLEQREAEKMWIYQKRQELEQVQMGWKSFSVNAPLFNHLAYRLIFVNRICKIVY
ncbi:hypothetical protein [Nostoc sp.]